MIIISRSNTTRLFIVIVQMISSFYVHGQNPEMELKLHNDLFLNYSKVRQPVTNITMPVELDATLELFKIANFDTVNGVLVSQCFLELSWYDKTLSWDPEKYANISMMYVSAKEIWRPNIVVCNSAATQFINSGADNAILHSDGRMVLSYQDILRTFCKINALNYPFDKQHCRILIGVAVQKLNHIMIKQLHYRKSSFFRNFEWDVEMKGIGKPLNNAGRSMTKATIYFSRKIRITTIASMVPSAIFTVVSVFVFLLPTESGEKVSLSTTLLLSNIVYLVEMDKVAPKNSESMPLITVYVLILTIWSGFNTIGAIMESKIYFTKERKADVKKDSLRKDDQGLKSGTKKKKSNHVIDIPPDNYSYVENTIHDSVHRIDSTLNSEDESEEKNDVTCKEHSTRHQKMSKIFLALGVVYIIISIIAISIKAFVK